MFLKEGLNDFIAKPIEFKDIMNKIRKWLPEEKIVPVSTQPTVAVNKEETDIIPQIKGIDPGSALSLINNKALLRNIMQQFYRSIEQKEARIRSFWKNNDIKNFTIEVHSLKSSAKQIGANHLSSVAAGLEQAGLNNDLDYISRHTNAMLIEFLRLRQDMSKYFGEADPAYYDEPVRSSPSKNKTVLTPATPEESDIFQKMQNALDEMDSLHIDDVLEKMLAMRCSDEEKAYLKRLKNAVEDYDLDAAQEVLTEWWKFKKPK